MPAQRKIKIINGIQYNQCTKCGKWHPATHKFFNYENKSKNKLCAKCKDCRHVYTIENKDKIALYRAEYQKNNKTSGIQSYHILDNK